MQRARGDECCVDADGDEPEEPRLAACQEPHETDPDDRQRPGNRDWIPRITWEVPARQAEFQYAATILRKEPPCGADRIERHKPVGKIFSNARVGAATEKQVGR